MKPYVKSNKSDYLDAKGSLRMRFVPIKIDDQLDLQSLHRVRERCVMRRTAVINQIRRLLFERGMSQRSNPAPSKPVILKRFGGRHHLLTSTVRPFRDW